MKEEKLNDKTFISNKILKNHMKNLQGYFLFY